MAYGVRIKDDQTVVVCGAVGGSSSGGNGNGFPTTPGAHQETFAGGTNDSFVSRFSADGSAILESTFVGLGGDDRAYFLDVDSEEDIWIYMQSSSPWVATEGAWGTGTGDVLVHKLSGDLSELLITSRLSDQNDANGAPVAFMVDLCNGIYTSAYFASSGFVASPDALFSSGGFYLGVYEPDMSGLIYGTYYTENHVDGGTSRFDKQGVVYQGVCSGGGFNTTPDAYAPNQATGWDIGVFKIDFEVQSVNAVAGAAGYLTGCAPHTVFFQNFSIGVDLLWDFGDGTTSDEFEPSHLYENPGEYLVMLIVTDPESCNLVDTAFIPITVFPEVEFFADFTYDFDCETGIVEITDASSGPGDIVYEWDMGDGTTLFDQNPVHTYEQPGEYTISLSLSSAACNQSMVEEQVLIYIPFVSAEFALNVIDFCEDFTVAFFNQTLNGATYIWDLGDGTVVTESGNFEYLYPASGTYQVEMIANNPETCNLADTLVLEVVINEPPVLNPEISITQTGFCKDLTFLASVEPNGPAGAFEWTFNGEEAGNTMVLESNVDEPGPYLIEVTVFDAVCDAAFPVSVPFDFYEVLGFELPTVLYLCYYQESLSLDATVPFEAATYSWNGGISQEPVLVVTEEGDYEVTVGYNGCIEVQDTDVNFGPEYPLAFNAIICQGLPNTIQFIDFPAIENVFWDNGQTGFTVEITDGGYHPFRAVDVVGCDQIDSLLAIPRPEDPMLQIPNIFTPNGDGKNDVFQIQGDSLSFFDLEMYDRWGRMIFRTNEIYGSWDGTQDGGIGDTPSDGVMMYILKYRDLCDQQNRISTGNITVVR
jgi:gliding motility-associated-like protein